jgi:predicted transposase/invertase (TIGR01784 family)
MDNSERYINPYTDFGFKKHEESRKEYWDYTSTLQTAEKKGHAEGKAEGLAEGMEKGERKANEAIARKLKSMGVLSVEQIADTTGLSAEEIEKL